MPKQNNRSRPSSRKASPPGRGPPSNTRRDMDRVRERDSKVPFLTYGENSNLLSWTRLMEVEASRIFGDIAMNVLKDDSYGYPTEPNPEDYDLDPHQHHIILYREDVREFRAERIKINSKKVSFYYHLYGCLSPESIDAIKKVEGYQEFHGRDPLRLWLAIKETHGVNESYQHENMIRMALRNQLKSCRQGDHEGITGYYERFLHHLNAVNDAQENDLNDADVAMDFFFGLSDRSYDEFKKQFTNDVNQGKIECPTTLIDMYGMAGRFIPTIKPLGQSNATAFATHAQDCGDNYGQDRVESRNDRRKTRGGGRPPTTGKNNSDLSKDQVASSDKNKDNVKCFNCQGMGHYANECPSKKKIQVKWTCAVPQDVQYDWYQVLLDNQADRSIVHPRLLTDLHPARAVVTGITGDSIPINQAGDLRGFGEVLASNRTGVSVLSFAEVEAKYNITYKRRKCFVVHLPDRDLVFRRRRNMYVANMMDWDNCRKPKTSKALVTTAAQLEQDFMKTGTREEVKRARRAMEFMRNAGVASERDAINLLDDGNITGADLTASDVRNAIRLYGQSSEFYRGKMTQRAAKKTPIDPSLKDNCSISQVAASDIMHIHGKKFLLTLVDPLGLLLVTHLDNLAAESLRQAFQGQVDTVASRGYQVRVIHIDPQSGCKALEGSIPGVEIDIQGAGDHSDKIDPKIRRVKETFRAVHAGIPWNLPRAFVYDLVVFCVSRLNMRRPQSVSSGVAPPRVKFTGRKPAFKKEFTLSFGDYVEAYKPGVVSRDAMKERSDPCLALYPTGNANGSWVMYNIKTRRRVRRTNWRKMVTTQLVIDAVNQLLADEANGIEIVAALDEEQPPAEELHVEETLPSNEDEDTIDTGVLQHHRIEPTEQKLVVTGSGSAGDNADTDYAPPLGGGDDSDYCDIDEEEEDPPDMVPGSESEDDDEDEDESPMAHRRVSQRIASGVQKPERFQAHHMSVKKGISEYGQAAHDAMLSELKQLFVDKQAFEPVLRSNLTAEQRKKVIRSFMFLKAKYDGMGAFEKIKARLVANGAQQEDRPKHLTAAPTVGMPSLMMILSIAAKERRQVATVDIGGAYLNATMDSEEVFMEMDSTLVEVVRKFLPAAVPFIDKNGKLVVKLKKALYGCVQSALLWYETLAKFLTSIGLKANQYDRCVWNIEKDSVQLSVVLYVDDLLITCKSDTMIDWLLDALESEFKDLKKHREPDLSYLGMHLKWGESNGWNITVSMAPFIRNMLEDLRVTGRASSPAENGIFDLDESPPIDSTECKKFHTVVAKLLYLTHRTRPDIMLAVSFLTTRVSNPTALDQKKLDRVLKYLNNTMDMALVLKGAGGDAELYVDAAFALHDDGMSHSGALFSLFGDTIETKSSKQKIVTRESTEAELVALSDKIMIAIKNCDFLRDQGVTLNPPIVYQDNTSTISLVTVGGGKYRNKYMRVRQQWVLQMVRDGDVKIVHIGTGKMIADGLTKPLQGTLGRYMANRMLTGDAGN